MNTSSTNEGKKSSVHVQLLSYRHQKQVRQAEKTSTPALKVHRLNRINGTASSAQQQQPQQPTPKSVTKSAVITARINAKKFSTNNDTSTGDAVQTPRLFANRVTDLNSSNKSAHTWPNNSSMMEVIECVFHRLCV